MARKQNWTAPAIATAVILGSAILGFSAAGNTAQAAPVATMYHWACNSFDACGAGSKECCNDQNTSIYYAHCSTSCPIVVN